ncbi:hypothetical protein HJ526_13420 [Donghicola sp. C2-DW-16]|uniref:NIDO domain-containing protein n=1 Tax=Donghicola mangrovi TaxID=2729614 RepID=A0ABX2PG98_9RHOB|nr:nidogen-like domain-containing protein [Donghicola mangrovi]NVO28428.1 hypothetical protein [Donghicola mangrovi]
MAYSNYRALLVNDADGWHDGDGTITYSFADDTPPDYYETLTFRGQEVYDIAGYDVSTSQSVSMTEAEQDMTLRAIAAWNEVANVNLVAYSGETSESTKVDADTTARSYVSVLPFSDDTSTQVDISAVFEDGLNIFGETLDASTLYVNSNGSITFGEGFDAPDPYTLNEATPAIIAAFWTDIVTGPEGITKEIDVEAGTVTFEWRHVTSYSGSLEDDAPENTFSITLVDQGDGDFDIIFDYSEINWTYEDISGAASAAVAGFASSATWYETVYSASLTALSSLDSDTGNTGTTGVYTYQFRDGYLYIDGVLSTEIAARGSSYAAEGTTTTSTASVGDIVFGSAEFDDPDLYGFTAGLPYDGALDTVSSIGDVWINSANSDQENGGTPAYGHTSWNTYLHEIGHSLGLEHPNDDPSNEAVTNQETVMSYIVHPSEADEDDVNQAWPLTPMVWDIQAIQALYGANTTTRTTNTVYFGNGNSAYDEAEYQYATNDDNSLGMQVLGEDGIYRDVILTIWDAGGIDLIDASDMANASDIDLRAGKYSSIGEIEDNIAVAAAVRVDGRVINWVENAWGGQGDDRIRGNGADNQLRGNIGADTLIGAAGNDTLGGGSGDDSLSGGSGQDRLAGHDGDDILSGGNAKDVLLGGAGNDSLNGGAKDDVLRGNGGSDALSGGTGHDLLVGGAGDDDLFGGVGNDTLRGNAGQDTLVGSFGDDLLFGGSGADVFGMGAGDDVIGDFDVDTSGELITIEKSSGILRFTDLIRNHAVDTDDGVVITDDHGNTLTLADVALAELSSDHFAFY